MYTILIFILFFQFSLNILVYPFKTAYINRNGNISKDSKEYNSTHFYNDNTNIPLYIDMKIGNPYQTVKVLLSSETCSTLKIGKSIYCIYSDDYLSTYNRNISSDFNYTSVTDKHDLDFDNDLSGQTAEETIYGYTDIKLQNETEFKKVGFFLGSDTTDKLCGTLGFEKDNLYCQNEYNISKYLKSRKYVNNFKYMVKYNTSEEGFYILGGELSDIMDDYNDTKKYSLNAHFVYAYDWGFYFSEIKTENKTENSNITVLKDEEVTIGNDFSLIYATKEYRDAINNLFFNQYIEKGICFYNLHERNSDKYHIYECDKAKFGKKDLEKFPTLYLGAREYGTLYEFKFDYNELFTETKYKYFFNIIIKDFSFQWTIGKLFLKKYAVNYDVQRQMVEIYNNDIYEGKNPDDGDRDTNYLAIYIISITVLILVAGVLGYFLGKYINKMRKRRANELLDDYDYNAETEPKPVLDS